jgi:hypothetical protein
MAWRRPCSTNVGSRKGRSLKCVSNRIKNSGSQREHRTAPSSAFDNCGGRGVNPDRSRKNCACQLSYQRAADQKSGTQELRIEIPAGQPDGCSLLDRTERLSGAFATEIDGRESGDVHFAAEAEANSAGTLLHAVSLRGPVLRNELIEDRSRLGEPTHRPS